MLQHTAVVVTCSEPAEPCASQRLDFCLFTVSSGCFLKSYLQSKTKVLLPASKAAKPSGVAKP